MHRQRILLLLTYCCGLSALENRITKLAEDFMQEHNVPGMAIALYVKGEERLLHLGVRDRTTEKPVTTSTLFEIASISKILVCLLLAQEINRGSISLNDPIANYIPELANNRHFKKITLFDLATHTSMLRWEPPEEIVTEKDFFNYLNNWTPPSTPPLRWMYSNSGIELIRYALEHRLHHSFDRLLIERILNPLKISPLSISRPKEYLRYHATGYTRGNKKTYNWDSKFLKSIDMHFSSSDMLQLVKASLGVQISARIKKAMRLTQTPVIKAGSIKQGLGWEIREPDKKIEETEKLYYGCPAYLLPPAEQVRPQHALFEKTGTSRGFQAYIGVLPSKHIGVGIMVNRRLYHGQSKMKKLGKKIMAILNQEK